MRPSGKQQCRHLIGGEEKQWHTCVRSSSNDVKLDPCKRMNEFKMRESERKATDIDIEMKLNQGKAGIS